MKILLATFATFALLFFTSARAYAAGTEKVEKVDEAGQLTLMSDVTLVAPDAPEAIAKVGDTEIAIRPLPSTLVKDSLKLALASNRGATT